MADIVQRLRDPKPLPWRYIEEAADEIERLRRELASGADTWLLEAITIWKHRAEAAEAGWKNCAEELERLRHRCRELDASLTYALDDVRNDALEEAAQAVEAQHIRFADRVTIAAAVRALKDNNHDRR